MIWQYLSFYQSWVASARHKTRHLTNGFSPGRSFRNSLIFSLSVLISFQNLCAWATSSLFFFLVFFFYHKQNRLTKIRSLHQDFYKYDRIWYYPIQYHQKEIAASFFVFHYHYVHLSCHIHYRTNNTLL